MRDAHYARILQRNYVLLHYPRWRAPWYDGKHSKWFFGNDLRRANANARWCDLTEWLLSKYAWKHTWVRMTLQKLIRSYFNESNGQPTTIASISRPLGAQLDSSNLVRTMHAPQLNTNTGTIKIWNPIESTSEPHHSVLVESIFM